METLKHVTMKKVSLLVITLVAGMSAGMAQDKISGWGLKGGMNFPMDGFTFDQAGDNISSIFTQQNNANGWHAGLWGRAYVTDRIYLGSELLYLHNTTEISAKTESGDYTTNFNRSGVMMDGVAGIRFFRFLRVQGGVNGMAYVNNTWQDTFDTFGAGYTFGTGVDIWKVSVDVGYFGSFKSQQGNWQGVPLSYDRSDLLVSLSFKF
jgi:hypothetical protein